MMEIILTRNLDFGNWNCLFVRLGHILVLLMRGSKEKDLRYFKYLSVNHGSSVGL